MKIFWGEVNAFKTRLAIGTCAKKEGREVPIILAYPIETNIRNKVPSVKLYVHRWWVCMYNNSIITLHVKFAYGIMLCMHRYCFLPQSRVMRHRIDIPQLNVVIMSQMFFFFFPTLPKIVELKLSLKFERLIFIYLFII